MDLGRDKNGNLLKGAAKQARMLKLQGGLAGHDSLVRQELLKTLKDVAAKNMKRFSLLSSLSTLANLFSKKVK
jgi:hypothetical protein